MHQSKISQHYVYQRYLKEWTVDEQLFCLMPMNGRQFLTSPKAIAQGKYFYRPEELSPEETAQVVKFFDGFPNEPKQSAMRWIVTYKTMFDAVNEMLSHNINSALRNDLEAFKNNAGEDIMCKYENFGLGYLNKLYAGDTSFYSDEDSFGKFNSYLIMQYLRTKKMLKAVMGSGADETNGKSWYLIRHGLVDCLVWRMQCTSDDWELIMLDNNTEIPFITGDQPVVNIAITANTPVKEMTFYYPVTPRRGILVKKKGEEYRDINDSSDVLFYNNLIVYFHESQIYSNSERIKDFITQEIT